MSFLISLLLVVFVTVGPCLPQDSDPFVLFRGTLEAISQKQDMILQRFNEQERKMEILQTMMQVQVEEIQKCSTQSDLDAMKTAFLKDQKEVRNSSEQQCSSSSSSTKDQITTLLRLIEADLCAEGNNKCSSSATCVCMQGYSGDGFRCEDIDECKDDTNVCGDEEVCINLPGNYSCICQDGYENQGDICQDVDECKADTNVCGDEEVCVNVPGNYTCICQDGFVKQGDISQDIDECSVENNCHKYASCTNTQGNKTCQCLAGYDGDGYTCTGFVCSSPRLEIEPLGCITYVEEWMTWSDAQAKCNQDGGSLLYGFTTKQQLITISQHVYQHFDTPSTGDLPWVGVRGGLFVKSPSDDGPPGGTSSITLAPHPHLWFDGEPTGTVGDDTQCGNIVLHHSDPEMFDDDCSSYLAPSLCQILY